EVDGAFFAQVSRLAAFRKDLEDPGLDTRATLKASDPCQDGEPGLLNHLFRHLVAWNECEGEASERCAVGVYETYECRLVAASQAVYEVRLGGAHLRGRRHRI